jgi:hypothetical protein
VQRNVDQLRHNGHHMVERHLERCPGDGPQRADVRTDGSARASAPQSNDPEEKVGDHPAGGQVTQCDDGLPRPGHTHARHHRRSRQGRHQLLGRQGLSGRRRHSPTPLPSSHQRQSSAFTGLVPLRPSSRTTGLTGLYFLDSGPPARKFHSPAGFSPVSVPSGKVQVRAVFSVVTGLTGLDLLVMVIRCVCMRVRIQDSVVVRM